MIGKTNSEGVAVDIDALTASPGDVRAGKKFVGSGTDETQTGTAVDRGAPTATLKCGEKYTIGSGIYNGGTITAATLASQTSGNATAADLKTGVKAWVGGVQLTGSMKNWAGTPNHIQSRRIANGRFEVAVDAGYHGCSWNGNSYEYMTYAEVASTLGLTAGNLAQGTTKCGLTGTYKGLGNAVAADVRKGKTFSSASLSNTTGTMAEQGGSTTTPGTANKTIVAANRYVTGNVVVAGDANLKAENIRKGKTIFGVAGTADVYDKNEMILINGSTVNGIIERFNHNITGLGKASVINEKDGIKIRADSYSYKSGREEDRYVQGTDYITSNRPINKLSYSKLRVEWEIYKVTPLYGSCYFKVEMVKDSLSTISSNTIVSGTANGSNTTIAGTLDIDISNISSNMALYIRIAFYSSGAGASTPTYPTTGSYIKIKKMYFTN